MKDCPPESFDSLSAIDGMLLELISFLVPMYVRAYVPKGILFTFKSISSLPSIIFAALKKGEKLPFDGKRFYHSTEDNTKCVVINIVYLLKGME